MIMITDYGWPHCSTSEILNPTSTKFMEMRDYESASQIQNSDLTGIWDLERGGLNPNNLKYSSTYDFKNSNECYASVHNHTYSDGFAVKIANWPLCPAIVECPIAL